MRINPPRPHVAEVHAVTTDAFASRAVYPFRLYAPFRNNPRWL
jgi:hypothetical protein